MALLLLKVCSPRHGDRCSQRREAERVADHLQLPARQGLGCEVLEPNRCVTDRRDQAGERVALLLKPTPHAADEYLHGLIVSQLLAEVTLRHAERSRRRGRACPEFRGTSVAAL